MCQASSKLLPCGTLSSSRVNVIPPYAQIVKGATGYTQAFIVAIPCRLNIFNCRFARFLSRALKVISLRLQENHPPQELMLRPFFLNHLFLPTHFHR